MKKRNQKSSASNYHKKEAIQTVSLIIGDAVYYFSKYFYKNFNLGVHAEKMSYFSQISTANAPKNESVQTKSKQTDIKNQPEMVDFLLPLNFFSEI